MVGVGDLNNNISKKQKICENEQKVFENWNLATLDESLEKLKIALNKNKELLSKGGIYSIINYTSKNGYLSLKSMKLIRELPLTQLEKLKQEYFACLEFEDIHGGVVTIYNDIKNNVNITVRINKYNYKQKIQFKYS
jgi:16S rRNA C1402 N4-methylase RsmH